MLDDVVDCETALEKDISEPQILINNHEGTKLEQLRYEKLEAERRLYTEENLQRLSKFAILRGWY